MQKKKILIISQPIFPSQFPRAFRATELAKELARQGHDVTLYGVLGNYDYVQFEREASIKVKNIGKMLFSKFNSDGTYKWNLFDRGLRRLFGKLLEFPDIELMFKIPGILKKESGIDYLITVGMPYPLHWGAAFAKTFYPKKFPKKWIADCGDPYMGNKFNKPYFYFKYIEKWFCKIADYITIPLEAARQGYYKEFTEKIRVIPQGFNFDNLPTLKDDVQNHVPSFAYAGVFYPKKRDPTLLLEYLSSLKQDFKFVIFTSDMSLISPFMEKLGSKIEVHPYIPRDELLKILVNMDFLVNIENGTQIQSPSKLIDYALTGRPILSLNSFSLNKEIINDFLCGHYEKQFVVKDLQQYNIENVASKFVDLLDE